MVAICSPEQYRAATEAPATASFWSIGLGQVLRGVIDIVDHAKVRLKHRVAVLKASRKLELVPEVRSARSNVVAGRNANLVQDAVIKVVLV